MILGVDHISVAAASVSRDADAVERLGLIRRFSACDLENAPEKRQLLNYWQPLHDVALYDGKVGPALELTVHGPIVRPAGHFGFVPIIGLATDTRLTHGSPSIDLTDIIRDAFGLDVLWLPLPGLSGAGVWGCARGSTGIVGAVHFTRNLAASSSFFSGGLTFRELRRGATGGRDWRVYEKASHVPRWAMRLLLAEVLEPDEAQELELDSAGFPCLALLTTDISGDRAALLTSTGIKTAVDFSIEVDCKALSVSQLRGPSGEIIELIEVGRTRGAPTNA